MNKIKALPKSVNLPQMEEEVLKFWTDTKAFEKSVEMRPADKQYVFYDGPPFATGMPHYGHLLGSTSKDVIPRYWTMKGYRVERIWGWDCHGLPIENMIEKQLDIKGGKKGIEALGIDKFNDACRAEVLRLDKEWEKIIGRLGRWADFEHNYKTMDTTFMESVWWGFQQLWEKGLVYEGRKVILYCPRCATPLSNFEIAMDNSYREVTEPSNTYKYKIKNAENTFILAWSTTPWNKLATPALAVNPELQYVKVKQGNEFYILADTALKMLTDVPYEVVATYQGSELEQFEFELHYDFYPDREGKRAGVIVADPFVTAEEGTGVVTLAVYGEEDFKVMQEQNIQMVEHVDEEGKFKPEVTPWAGMFILKANPLINADLAERGLMYREDPHTHSVAECYRCSTRLYYAPLPAWFIDVQKLKSQLIAQNEFMNWYPEHLKHGRFGKGLETAPDWNISRSRYWGTPMPIWEADVTDEKGKPAKKRRIVGSIAEFKKWAVDPSQVEGLTDIHREFLDHIEVWVDDERTLKGKRTKEVFDCWVESGSMPFASKHYPFENKELFESTYPAQFVSEYIAQTRAWFYTMHVMSVGVFGKLAVENTLTTGTVLAEDGNKMSKSKKNYPDPMKIINEIGSDSLRLYLMSSPVMRGENLNFSETEVNEIRKKIFVIWWNCISFYKLNAGETAVDLNKEVTPATEMDRWIWSRLGTLTGEVTTAMDNYDVVKASRAIMGFISDLSNWYVRRSRDQMRDGAGKADSLHLYGVVLVRLAQLAAPFTPFFSDFVWQTLVDESSSIHHTDWPAELAKNSDLKLEEEMEYARKIVEKALFKRQRANIKVRQPLAKLMVLSHRNELSSGILNVIAEETNVQRVQWFLAHTPEGLLPGVELSVTLGKELIEEYDETKLSVALDTEMTNELKEEGAARELVRSIQNLRKAAGMSLSDTATVSVPTMPSAEWQQWVEQKTNSKLEIGSEFKLNS
jgi:isoleucyl-tRNA synthetase